MMSKDSVLNNSCELAFLKTWFCNLTEIFLSKFGHVAVRPDAKGKTSDLQSSCPDAALKLKTLTRLSKSFPNVIWANDDVLWDFFFFCLLLGDSERWDEVTCAHGDRRPPHSTRKGHSLCGGFSAQRQSWPPPYLLQGHSLWPPSFPPCFICRRASTTLRAYPNVLSKRSFFWISNFSPWKNQSIGLIDHGHETDWSPSPALTCKFRSSSGVFGRSLKTKSMSSPNLHPCPLSRPPLAKKRWPGAKMLGRRHDGACSVDHC